MGFFIRLLGGILSVGEVLGNRGKCVCVSGKGLLWFLLLWDVLC